MNSGALALAVAAALSGGGCVCNAHCENEFEAACQERGGALRMTARAQHCVTSDGNVVGTWVLDDAGADEDAGGT
jgi:hypothetical protein